MKHRPRKRFGQNFLTDGNIIEKILQAIAPRSQDHIVEIGPGQGALTRSLIASGASIEAIEIDRDLHAHLKGWFTNESNFTIHQADALRYDFSQLIDPDYQLRVVGNLPYNISTPLIFHLLSYADSISDMLFMLQKEVVQRMAAGPGGRDYGRLSVMVQYHCQVEALFVVPPGAFSPPPKVESAIVRLVPHREPPHPALDEACLRRVVNACFQQRRKTLRNGLKGLLTAEALESLGIDSKLRAEQLPLAEFVRISNAISENPQDHD